MKTHLYDITHAIQLKLQCIIPRSLRKYNDEALNDAHWVLQIGDFIHLISTISKEYPICMI